MKPTAGRRRIGIPFAPPMSTARSNQIHRLATLPAISANHSTSDCRMWRRTARRFGVAVERTQRSIREGRKRSCCPADSHFFWKRKLPEKNALLAFVLAELRYTDARV